MRTVSLQAGGIGGVSMEYFDQENNKLPDGWQLAPLMQVSTVRTGKKDANHAEVNGKYRFYTCAYEHIMCNTKSFEGECLILPGNGANVGEVFYYNGKFEAYQRTYVIEGIKILPQYLFYHLRYDWKSINADKQYGSATNYIRIGNFENYFVKYPHLPEQKRIVAEIEKQFSRLDEAVENLKRVKANLKRYKASVLKAAVEGKLTEDWRKKNLPAPSSKSGKFYTYAILCDNDSIYIGQTDDIARRWKQHLEGKGAEWTTKHKPLKIVHWEEFDTRKEAAKREKWLKTGCGRKWIKREYAAGRTRQAGHVEPADNLLERILAERRKKWEEAELAKMKAKGKEPKDDKWKKRYKKPDVADQINMKLPNGWVKATVKQLSQRVQYGSSSKTSESSGNIPVLRMGNIFEGKLLFDKLKYLPESHDEFPELLLEPDELLFNRTNSPELVGKTAVYKGKPSSCSFASYLIRVRFINGVDPNFISYFINSNYGRKWIKLVVSQQVGQANVNGTKLQALSVPLPPYIEQGRIVSEVENKFSIIDRIEKEVGRDLIRADRLRQSILKKAFSGKLLNN